jgi:hypothetical protein
VNIHLLTPTTSSLFRDIDKPPRQDYIFLKVFSLYDEKVLTNLHK